MKTAKTDAVRERFFLKPEIKRSFAVGRLEEIIGPAQTDCFRVDLLTVEGEVAFATNWPWQIGVVSEAN